MTPTEQTETEQAQAAPAEAEQPTAEFAPAGGFLNALDELGDVEEIDPDANVDDQPPPPPKGTYQIRLRNMKDAERKKLEGIAQNGSPEDAQLAAKILQEFPDANISWFRTKKDGKLHFSIVIEQELVSDDPLAKNRKNKVWKNTMISQFVPTSAVDTFLRILTGRAGVGMTAGRKIAELYGLLATEPVCLGELDWSGQTIKLDKEGQPVLRENGKPDYTDAVLNGKKLNRMENFPFVEVTDSATGEARRHYKPAEYDDHGNTVITSWEIRKYLQLGPSA